MMEPKVEETDANDSRDIILNDDCLIHVFEYLPISDRIRLQRVNKRWQAVSRASWSSFTTLDFSNELWGGYASKTINDNSIAKVLAQCGKYLTHCEMHNKFALLGSLVPDINFDVFKLCPNLKSIDFFAARLTTEKMKFFAKHCKNIEEIWFGYTDSQKDRYDHIIGTFAFGAYKNLRIVRFTFCSITGICLRNLSTVNLEELDFYCCFQLLDNEINYVISKCPKLKKLILRKNPCTDYSVIRYPKHLQMLDISNSENSIKDDFLNKLTKTCTNLLGLNITCINSEVTDIGIAYVASLPKLQYLCLDKMPLITGQNFLKMTHLKVLSCLECTSLSEEHLEALLEVSEQLESLNVSGCKLVTANFVSSAVNILSTRKNDIILNISMLHIDQYAVELPNNLKIKFKDWDGSYFTSYTTFKFPNQLFKMFL